jgi:hypothetical protein
MDASAGEIGDKNTFMLQQIFTARHFLEENGKLLWINPAAKSDSLSSTWTYGKLCSSDVHRKKMLQNTPDSSFSHKVSSKLEDIRSLALSLGS